MSEMYPLAALWEYESKKGRRYWRGRLGEASILMFRSESDNPRAPAFKIYVTEHVSQEERERRESEFASEPGPDPDYPEIPF